MNPTPEETLKALAEAVLKLPKAMPLSFSKLKALTGCPRRYQKLYLQRAPKGDSFDSAPAVVGKFVHDVLEAAVAKARFRGYSDEGAQFPQTWGAMYKAYPLTQQEKDMVAPLRGPAERMLHRVLKAARDYQLNLYPEQMYVLTPQGTAVATAEWSDRFVYGFLDLLGLNRNLTRGLLIDYKTHALSEDHVTSADTQTQLYALACFLRYPTLQRLQAGGAFIPSEALELTTFTREDVPRLLEALVQLLEEFIALHPTQLEAEDLPSVTGKPCLWCQFTAGCDSGLKYISKHKR